MADPWEPPTLAKLFHWLPRRDLEGNEVSSSYNIHSYSYREALLQIANLHLLWLFVVFLTMSIYLTYRWCVPRPRDIVRPTSPRRYLRRSLLLICVVLLLFCFFLEFIVQSIYMSNMVMDKMLVRDDDEDIPDIERDVEPHVTAFFNKPSSILYHIRYWANYNFRSANPPPSTEWAHDNFHSNLYNGNDDECEVNRVADETNLRHLVVLYDSYVKRSIADLNMALKNKSFTKFKDEYSDNDDPKKILETEISRYDRIQFFLIIWTGLLILLLLAIYMLRYDKFFWVPVYFALWSSCVSAAGLTVTCVALGDACQNPEKTSMFIETPKRSVNMENHCKTWTSQVYVRVIDLAHRYIDSMIESLHGLRSSVFDYCDIDDCKKPENRLHNAAYYFGVYTRRQIYDDFHRLDDKLTDFVLKCPSVLRKSQYDTQATVKGFCDGDRLLVPIILQLISNLVIAGLLIAVMFIYISSRQCILPPKDQLSTCNSKKSSEIFMQNGPLLMASFSGETPDVIISRVRRSYISSPDKDIYAPYKEHTLPQRRYTPRCLTSDEGRDYPGSEVARRLIKHTLEDVKRSESVGTPRRPCRPTDQNTCVSNKKYLCPQRNPPERLSGFMERQHSKSQVKESKPSLNRKQDSIPESLKKRRQFEQKRSDSDSEDRSEKNLRLNVRNRPLRSISLSSAMRYYPTPEPCSTKSPLRLKSSTRTNTSSREPEPKSPASIKVQNIREFKEHSHVPCGRTVNKQRNYGSASNATLFKRPRPCDSLHSHPHNIPPSFSRSANSCRRDDDKESIRNRELQIARSNPNLKGVVLHTPTAGWQSRPNIKLHFNPRKRNNEDLPDSIKKGSLLGELSIERNSSTTISTIDTPGVSPPGPIFSPSEEHELTLYKQRHTEASQNLGRAFHKVLDVPSCGCDLTTPSFNTSMRRRKGSSEDEPLSYYSLPIRGDVTECPLFEQSPDECLPTPDYSGARHSPRDSTQQHTAKQKQRFAKHTVNEKISGIIEDDKVTSPFRERSRTSERRNQHQKPCIQQTELTPLSLSNSMSCTRKRTTSCDRQSLRTIEEFREPMLTSDDVAVVTPNTATYLTSQLAAQQVPQICEAKRRKTVYLKMPDHPSIVLSSNDEDI